MKKIQYMVGFQQKKLKVDSKKVFIDASLFSKEEQGSLTYLRELYKSIIGKNDNFCFVFGCSSPDAIIKIFGNQENIGIYNYFFKNKFLRLFIETPIILWKNNFSAAHFQYVTPFIKPLKCKYIVTIHDVLFLDHTNDFTLWYRVVRKFLFFISVKISDLTLTVSDYSRQRISKHLSIDINKIRITPNAVSEDFLTFKFNKQDSKIYIKKFEIFNEFILYVSRIEPRKNQIMLLDLFCNKISLDDSFTIVFIGSMTLESGFKGRFLALKEKYPRNIFYFESMNFNDLLHFYNSTKLFIYPSKCEGFGIPPLEAAIMRSPVLCSDLTAMKDFSFFNPLMFNPLIDDIIDEYNKANSKLDSINTELIRKQIIQKYNWSSGADVLINYYNKI